MTDQEAAINHCDNIHASKGPLPIMTAKELESVFIAGCAHARAGLKDKLEEFEDWHQTYQPEMDKLREERDAYRAELRRYMTLDKNPAELGDLVFRKAVGDGARAVLAKWPERIVT